MLETLPMEFSDFNGSIRRFKDTIMTLLWLLMFWLHMFQMNSDTILILNGIALAFCSKL